MPIKTKTISYKSKKSYKSKGWAERKVKELRAENAFHKKYKGKGDANHWNTKIKVVKGGKGFVVEWNDNMKIPVKHT